MEVVPEKSNSCVTSPNHRLLFNASPTTSPDKRLQESKNESESATEAELEASSASSTSSSIISVYTPQRNAPSVITTQHYVAQPRRSKRPRTKVKPFVSYEPTPPPSKKAKTTGASRAHKETQSTDAQSVSHSVAAPSMGAQSVRTQSDAGHCSDSDSFEILPTPEAPPIEYIELSDSSVPVGSISSASKIDKEVITISSKVSSAVKSIVSSVMSSVVSSVVVSSVVSSVVNSIVGGASREYISDNDGSVSSLSSVSAAPQSTSVVSLPPPPAQQSSLNHLRVCTALPNTNLPTTLPTVTDNVQIISSTSTSPLHTPIGTPRSTPLLAPLLTTQRTATHNDEPELQLPYIHTSSKVHIYTPTAANIHRLRDFFDYALKPTELHILRTICDTTPVVVYRDMTCPPLPLHYIIINMNGEVLSLKYFWKQLHRTQNGL